MMLDQTTPTTERNESHRLSLFPKGVFLVTERCNLLLVEPATVPPSNREQLLKAAAYGVIAVLDVREILELRFKSHIQIAVLNDLLGQFGLKAAAEAVRQQWPLARILILGKVKSAFDDHLYDEAISHLSERERLLDVLSFMKGDSWSQRVAGGYLGFRRAFPIADESDPTKVASRDTAGAPIRLDLEPQRRCGNG